MKIRRMLQSLAGPWVATAGSQPAGKQLLQRRILDLEVELHAELRTVLDQRLGAGMARRADHRAGRDHRAAGTKSDTPPHVRSPAHEFWRCLPLSRKPPSGGRSSLRHAVDAMRPRDGEGSHRGDGKIQPFAIEACRLVGPDRSTGAIAGTRWRTPVKTRHQRRFSSAARAARPAASPPRSVARSSPQARPAPRRPR